MKKNQINEDEIFLINENYTVRVETFGSNKDKIVVVDDFYANPHQVRQLALDIPASRNQRIRGGNPAWRVNAFYVLDDMSWIFDQLCRQHYPEVMEQWPQGAMIDSFKRATFMVNVMQSENLPPVKPHMDNPSGLHFASTIYLNNENESNGGTSFYEYTGTNVNEPVAKYITDSTHDWKMTGMVPMKFNRMVLYLQNVWHSAYVKPGMFTDDVYRLNQQFFI